MPEKLYEVLDVDDDASRSEIQSAYRRKVKECHPDVSDHPDASERFQLILKAREILTDQDQRDRYDDLGHDAYMDWFGSDGNGESGSANTTRSDTGDVESSASGSSPGTSASSSGAGPSDGTTDDEEAGGSTAGATGASASSGSEGTSAAGRTTGDHRSSSADDERTSTESSTNSGASTGTASKSSPGSATATDSSAGSASSASGSSPTSGTTASGSGANSEAETGGAADSEAETGEEESADGTETSAEAETEESNSSTSARTTTRQSSAVQGTTSAVDASAVSDAAERKRKRWQAQSRRDGTARGRGASSTASGRGGLRAERVSSGIATKIRSKDVAVMAVTMLVAYPIFVFSTVWPDFPLAVKVFVGLVTVGVVVYVLTEPAVSLVVFGTWSVLTPLLLVFIDVEPVSLAGLFALSVTWIPFLLAVLLTLAMPD